MSAEVIGRLNVALEGRYSIERQLGEGGMATVYLAQDVKHDRRVAVKVLKPELAAVVGAERFLAEIKTTANLQHPHILPLHDSGEADGFLFYVMPYVDGETLRTRIDREKQLSVADAIAITKKVAGALDYAHGNHVVHRDIKPANVLLSAQGEPLVADFGIALAVAQAGAGRITETGLSLGTPHYMSPEQATGDRDVDPRSDVYALGCVLYEMLAGQPPFFASTAQATLVQILTADVAPVTSLRRTVPPHVESALTRALEKLPADRFRSAGEFGRALDDESFSYRVRPTTAAAVQTPVVADSPPAAPPRPWLRDPRSVVALAALVLAAAFALLRPTTEPAPGVPTRAQVTGLDISRSFGGWRLAISPDGKWIAAGTIEGGTSYLFIRPAADPEWRRLPNTEGASNPSFSPDGQSIAFDNDEGLFRVPITGGPALPIASPGGNPHWTPDEAIVYNDQGRIYRVSASGGEPELLFESDSISASRPHLLPNGKAVIFGENTGGDPIQSRVLLYELETRALRVLVESGNQPRYAPTGHVVYAHGDQALMAVSFDLQTLERTGSPVTLLPRLTVYSGGASQFDISDTGTLIYDASASGGQILRNAILEEVALDGTATPLPLGSGDLERPRYSPDGRKIAYGDGDEIRVYDVVNGASPQFTSGGGTYAEWSPDGDYLYFTTSFGAGGDGFRRPADGRSEAVQLYDRTRYAAINDVGAGDSLILVREFDFESGRGNDLVILRVGTDSAVFEDYLTAEWDETRPQISPDGRWVVYQSDESGEERVYVHSFPVPTGQRAVSPGRGLDPVWGPNGRRIYYRTATRLMAVDVTTDPAFTVSAPQQLFEVAAYDLSAPRRTERNWDLHPDGDRFILVRPRDEGSATEQPDLLSEVFLVVNWFEELKERMGG